MSRNLLPTIAGFIVTNIVATALAMIVLQPLVSPMFGAYIRTDADGLAFAPLLAGYLVITLVLVWLMPRLKTGGAGWQHGALAGLALGMAVFLGDHLVTAGWSRLPALPMLLSGVVDTLAVVAGGIAIAVAQRRQVS